jgi:hypothetical protein
LFGPHLVDEHDLLARAELVVVLDVDEGTVLVAR